VVKEYDGRRVLGALAPDQGLESEGPPGGDVDDRLKDDPDLAGLQAAHPLDDHGVRDVLLRPAFFPRQARIPPTLTVS
jgi:hypothetical protein